MLVELPHFCRVCAGLWATGSVLDVVCPPPLPLLILLCILVVFLANMWRGRPFVFVAD